jgi:hypothetical protein
MRIHHKVLGHGHIGTDLEIIGFFAVGVGLMIAVKMYKRFRNSKPTTDDFSN